MRAKLLAVLVAGCFGAGSAMAADKTVEVVLATHDAGGVTERFDGIHLAVDPSLLSNWQTQTASVWSDYMALLTACLGKVNTYNGSSVHDLALGVDIPAWYDTAYPGITSSDSVQTLVDYVVVMARKDVAAAFFRIMLLVVLAIVLVIFGANKLPEIGKGMGQAIGNFKKSMKEKDEVDVTPAKGDGEKK